MKHIGIDFDDTLLDTRRVLVSILNRLRGTNFALEDLNNYYLAEAFQCTSEYLDTVFAQHFDELHALEPLPHALQTMHRARALGHRLTIITARPAQHMPPLYQWLARHGVPADHVISAPMSGEKALRAQEQGIEIFVDDNPRHAIALVARGIRVLLLDRPYNRFVLDPRMTRVPDWAAIAGILVPAECSGLAETAHPN